MDNFPDGVSVPDLTTLSYDDNLPYEEQFPTQPSNDPERATLLNRIGTSKVYLLPDTAQARIAKRKPTEQDVDADMDEDIVQTLRANALLLTGTPISHLPTARIFAYATHFDTHPLGLEWLNDDSCILVFESKASARTAQRYLQKSATEDMDVDGFVTAKPIPITLWPPEERINKSLGKGEGLKGAIRMRWAKDDDVKKKGAKKESKFYKKYGETAGKEGEGGEAPHKRRRRDDSPVPNQPDTFLGANRPSKMRSDYLTTSYDTVETTSSVDSHPSDLKSRITAPWQHRARGQLAGRLADSQVDNEEDGRRSRGRGRKNPRPQKTQQDLDDELDAFLKEKD